MTNLFALLKYIPAFFRILRTFGALILVAGAGVAGFIYSPFFRSFFLGIAVGSCILFGLEYSSFSFLPQEAKTQACLNPKIDPNGCRTQRWVSTDSGRGYGYWECVK